MQEKMFSRCSIPLVVDIQGEFIGVSSDFASGMVISLGVLGDQ